jgi:diguanylate cyclase (GGDEF)-like protein
MFADHRSGDFGLFVAGGTLADRSESAFVDLCPDLAVVLDAELRIVRASAGLRSAVPVCSKGSLFTVALDQPSAERLRQALALDEQGASALTVELVLRGRERLINASWRFFALEEGQRRQMGGLGRETGPGHDLAAEIDALKRRYQESMSQLAALTGRLRELAMIDSLTGVLNRRAFLDHADGEWVRHKRHQSQLACAMLDVDAFKRINDGYGHAAGDALLQHIGALLRATLRASDLPARLGGDEFVALMPETGIEGAVTLGERLLTRVVTQPLTALDQTITASVSIGVASAEQCNSLEELLARADGALYQAKKQGRSRVCRAE